MSSLQHHRTGRVAAVAVASLCLVGVAGCKTKKARDDKQPPPDLSGLAAVPDTARVVIGADPGRLAGSMLVSRAFELMLEREPELGAQLERLTVGCDLDWRNQLDQLHLVRTDGPDPLVVATGKLAEADLAKCVQNTVGTGGGSLTIEQVEGRTLYKVEQGTRTVFFAFGRADTVVLSGSRELVVAGLGSGPKVLDNPEMKALIDRADTHAPMWAVGQVDPGLGTRLLKLTGGRLTNPPRAFLMRLDPAAGLKADLTAVMVSEDDAKVLESQLNPTLALVSMAAQAKGLGQIAAKIAGSRERDAVRFGIELTDAEVKEVLSKVDSRPPPEQDASPGAPAPSSVVDGGAPGD
jgi:hypothetical protein